MSSWSSQHLLYGEGLMETVCCRFPRLLNGVYLIHKPHVVCVWQLHEPRDQMFVIIQLNKCINHSRLMKSHEISSRYREQWKDYRVRREKQKLLTLTVCVGIQAWDCGRFGVGWAAPSSQWNSPSYSPKHHEPNRAASDRSNWSPLNPAENTRHTENK